MTTPEKKPATAKVKIMPRAPKLTFKEGHARTLKQYDATFEALAKR